MNTLYKYLHKNDLQISTKMRSNYIHQVPHSRERLRNQNKQQQNFIDKTHQIPRSNPRSTPHISPTAQKNITRYSSKIQVFHLHKKEQQKPKT